MTALDCYGIGSLALVILAFYFIRNIRAYVLTCAAIVVGITVVTARTIDAAGLAAGLVVVLGTALCAFGLLIVRVMLIRSVSLNMLRSIQTGAPGGFGEDIGARLGDMRSFGLIRTRDGQNGLTAFGKLVSTVVAVFYALLRVRS